MITWMQRHKKYLVVTIWISTIAFIGAGFVGWGQYSYGDKAGAVAKVGDITITQGEFQKSYSNLFAQYNQLFQGRLDEKQAQQFGLPKQALRQLVNEALVLNLADEYGIQVTDDEVLKTLQSDPQFHKNGSFDVDTYTQVLTDNRLQRKEYEDNLRKQLLIQKTFYMISPRARPLEINTIASVLGIADKIEYKLLTPTMITLSPSDDEIQKYWSKHKKEYVKEASAEISAVRVKPAQLLPSEADVKNHYDANRYQFKSADGKLLEFEDAKAMVIASLIDEQTNKEALRTYIDFKKGTYANQTEIEKFSFSVSNSPFDPDITKEVMALNSSKNFLKPRKIGNDYLIIRLDKMVASAPKTYEEAKEDAKQGYMSEARISKLQELAQNSYQTFKGTETGFIKRTDKGVLADLDPMIAEEFLSKLFSSKQKRGFVTLNNGNVMMYNILEQKLLQDTTMANEESVLRLKGSLLDAGLLKSLESKYPIEIYIEGI